MLVLLGYVHEAGGLSWMFCIPFHPPQPGGGGCSARRCWQACCFPWLPLPVLKLRLSRGALGSGEGGGSSKASKCRPSRALTLRGCSAELRVGTLPGACQMQSLGPPEEQSGTEAAGLSPGGRPSQWERQLCTETYCCRCCTFKLWGDPPPRGVLYASSRGV